MNWRVSEGYGSLIAAAAKDVPVALSTPVSGIDASGRALRLTTARGEIEAARVIVTVPTDVLASFLVTGAAMLAFTWLWNALVPRVLALPPVSRAVRAIQGHD